MKTIIIYESLHGSTEKCAKILGGKIKGDIEIKRLQDNGNIRVDEYDIVIIGGSIHHGVIQSRIENFIHKNHSQLLRKKIGLYLCCMEEGEIAWQQFEKAYPSDLRGKAVATGLFGGEFNLDKMSLFEKKLTRKLTGIISSVSKINENEIWKFAEKINQVICE
jgi:menaquinone-dependent protoporphyrinogen oxidase